MPTIQVLPRELADQIAAGEVVDRPASVVKELVENAIDAGAHAISVTVENGGLELVRVSDDGAGMTPEDARLSVERHATSKLRGVADLDAIRTLGFRGEALPSIASVSRFVLTSRVTDSLSGTRVTIEGGAIPSIREAGCAPGTTVEVRDLFFNVPARRKFLRSTSTEAAVITDTCIRAALPRPDLRLTLLRATRTVRELLPAPSLDARIREVFPRERLEIIVADRDGLHVHALLGPPESGRSGASALHLYVNGRAVRDRALARAVAFAYGSVLPPGRYPVGAILLTLDPSEVDVNVHPQKAEVRFARGQRVHELLTRILAGALGLGAWRGPVGARTPDPPSERKDAGPSATEADPWELGSIGTSVRETVTPYRAATPTESVPGAAQISEDSGLLARGRFGGLRVLGQVHGMFIVCAGTDGLHVVDQHAADERVRFAALRRAVDARAVAVQPLLFPERVDLSAQDVAALDEHRDELRTLGIDCTVLGPTTVAVHAVPALVGRAPVARLVRSLVGELTHRGEREFGDAIDTVLSTMACHAAVRAGDEMSIDECRALLESLDGIESFRGHCPHGRPVVHTIPFDELERRLGRG